MKVTVSAPGKIFLMGEHMVVYGKPALLSAINKRVTVLINDSPKNQIASDDNKFIEEIIKIVINHFHIENTGTFSLSVNSEIKNGYHLGSSAAVSVAVSAALIYFLKKIWNPEVVNRLAYQAEKLKHGNPSGADNSIVSFGGFVWYRKELEFLKNIWQIPLKINSSLNHFYLLDTGKPLENTKQMVDMVRENYLKNPVRYKELFSLNEEMVRQIALAVKTGDSKLLIESMKTGENTLENIGVVSNKVMPVIREIENSGGAAKILGGGGRMGAVGYLLCFHKNGAGLKKIASKNNYSLEKVNVGEEGLRLENGVEK